MSSKKTNTATRPIGVFDSGIGGLTVVKELNRLLPNEKIIYFGDTARVPYGNKSKDTIIRYSNEIAKFLTKSKVKIIVVACNTASSVSIPSLRKHFTVPVIGVIEPGAKSAVLESKSKRIGVIGTLGTVGSNSYPKELKKISKQVRVNQKACPLFVQLAEEGWTNNKIAQSIADEYLKELKKYKIDTLILGCTHYPLLKNVVQNSVGNKVKLIDSGKETAKEVKKILQKKNLLNKTKHRQNDSVFYVSDLPNKFGEVAKRFMKRKLTRVYKVKL